MEIKKIIGNRYEIIRKLGEGGTAVVYLAFDRQGEFEVALKMLKAEQVSDQKIKYFNREAQAISMLNDDNIIKIYDIGYDEVNEVHYIAQEYVEGMTVKEYLKVSSKISVNEVITIASKVLRGLAHAHEVGVIHKDIKGQNILIDENKDIKITDFGIADIIEDDMTKTQSLMGTPQYVAPETLNRGEITAQTDVYSVGILMYELLCGTAPFTGGKPSVIMMKQLNQPLPSIRMQRKDVSQSLENVVIKATAKRVSNRYSNASEMLEDLDNVFSPANENVEKLILKDDLLEKEELEQTIKIDPDFRIFDAEKEVARTTNKKRRIKQAIAVFAVLIAAIGIWSFYLISSSKQMPDFTGLTENEALLSLNVLGYESDAITVKYEQSSEVEKGKIISTTPVAGTKLTNDSKFIILLSSGEELITVNDFVGSNAQVVKKELEEEGFDVQIKEIESEQPAGTIVSQSLEPGTEMKKGDKIEFEVSTGLPEIILPNFISLAVDEAKTWASDNDLQLTINYECSVYYNENIISAQDPVVGKNIERGSILTITVSEGQCTSPEIVIPASENTSEVVSEEKSENNE